MKNNPPHKQPSGRSELLMYSGAGGEVRVEAHYIDGTIWLTQKKMAELYGVDVRTISYHLTELIQVGELEESAVIQKIWITAADGKNYSTNVYKLEAIIHVGYRVNSYEAQEFRKWATQTLDEYLVKGFVIDDERLKFGKRLGHDYFDELLERIREIRASERRFYQKITDIYAECSVDYDKNSPITQTFFATVQNKLEWAITGMTAAELIQHRADHTKPNMGLNTWKNSPDGKILKLDVQVAKNYLSEEELKEPNRIVSMYLDFAELLASRKIPLKMSDWVERLDAFLQFNGYNILDHAGSITAQAAKLFAIDEYNKFRIDQDRNYESDFDKAVKKSLEIKNPPKE